MNGTNGESALCKVLGMESSDSIGLLSRPVPLSTQLTCRLGSLVKLTIFDSSSQVVKSDLQCMPKEELDGPDTMGGGGMDG